MTGKELRIWGPPGTGKTSTLKNRITKAATEEYEPEEIIVTSFTKAAAVELASRDLPIPSENVGTLHALCYRALGRSEIAETKIKEWNEQTGDLYQLSGDGADVDEAAYDWHSAAPGDAFLQAANYYRAKMVPLSIWNPDVAGFYAKWKAWKEATGYIDFTDMISLAYDTMDTAPGNPRVLFADEGQDFSVLELALIRKWGARCDHYYIAGDDDQCLYGFKGASPESFLLPELPANQSHVLGQSYRVPRVVQAFSQQWIQGVTLRAPKEYRPRDEEGRLALTSASYKNPAALLELVEESIATPDQRERPGNRVMLLAACGYMLDPLKHLLRANGIPYANPYRRKRGDWNPLYSARGTTMSKRLLAFLAKDHFWTYADLKAWTDIIKAEGIIRRGGKKELEETPKHLLSSEVTIDWVLNHLLFEDALTRALDGDIEWLMANLLKGKAEVMAYPYAIYRRWGIDGLKNEPKAVLGSIHSVKGGESDRVIVFPDLSPNGLAEYQSQGVRRDAVLRQFYVAWTRARQELIVAQPSSPLSIEVMI
jgi:superfamily I DNA/RNA helicase